MPTIYSFNGTTKDDGYVAKFNQATWAAARDATSGSTQVGLQSSASAIRASKSAGRGGGFIYTVYRSFFCFDTSGITGPVSEVNIMLRGALLGSGTPIAVQGLAFGGDGGTSLANGDFDSIRGWSAGSSLDGLATIYGTFSGTWSTSGYNTFSDSWALRKNMQDNDVVIVCVMNYDYDYLNVEPGASFINGLYYAEYTGGTRDPKIVYTLGYGNTVNGISSTNISKVNGIARADISKINGI
tara:strand:+ start:969 stop:1691 length:723 start_codon:yes stop_codon:yes gene_type:complete